ncbi:MAG: glycerophosphoryl diester phosphodiesterase [Flavobacteriaceae bacterium]|jgi:glycerophosphoryl diester phosphodiesterase|tara:strand:+ start:4416 stop:5177 length:762 start_codon:yes stop_codon:yes gene_type:complete
MKGKLFFYIVMILFITACTKNTTQNPLVIGHRGARGHIAENTLPSISKAISLGVDGVEIDVFRCATGELVVFHDHRLEKLTNATGYIEQLDLDSIRNIEVLDGFSIPTLEEVLDLIDGRVLLNIELKGAQTALLTNRLLERYFDSTSWSADKIIISSFNWEELEIFYQATTKVPIAILTEDDPLDAIPIAKKLNAVAINPNYKSLSKNNISKIKKAGFKLYPWTVNTPESILNLIALGVDGIITDYPERVPKQ